MDSSVRIDGDDVAVLTIDQPGSKVNVLTEQLWTDLEEGINSLMHRTDLRGLVIASAKPGVFIAGADLKLLGNAPGPNDPDVRAFIEHGKRVLRKLEALPFSTCAAIDGAALGGGLEVAMACDYRVVGNHPKVLLGLPEVTLGLIPGWGGTQRLPRAAGLVTAAMLLSSGQAFSRNDAIHNHVAEEGGDDAIRSARDILYESIDLTIRSKRLDRIPRAIRDEFKLRYAAESHAAAEALRVMVAGASLPLYEAIDLETEAFMQLAGSPESKRLIAEFFASRKR